MRRLRRFVGLSRPDQKLILHATTVLVISLARLRLQNIDQLRDWAGFKRSGSASVDRLIWAIERVSQIIPGATCLVRAIALQHLLSVNGHDSLLAIGVGRSDGNFMAHAWVAQGERVLIGGSAEMPSYKVIAQWSVSSQPASTAKTA